MTTIKTATQAIERSISHTEIVTLPWTPALELELLEASEDSTETEGRLETWGSRETDRAIARTAEAWWAWHDAASDRASGTMEGAEARAAAWVAGENDGPEDVMATEEWRVHLDTTGREAHVARVMRSLAQQDQGGETDDSYARTGDAEDTIARWYDSASQAGDHDLVQLVDAVGVRDLARVYAEVRS